MQYIKELKVPIDKPRLNIPVFAKQSDYNSRYFKITLTKGDTPLTSTDIGTVTSVAIGIKRGDGLSKAYAGEYSDGVFTLPLPKWAVERPNDTIACDVMVWSGSGDNMQLIRSALIEVQVQAAGMGDDDISKDDDYDILTELILQVTQLDQTVTQHEAERQSNEAEREKNEQGRITAEEGRVKAEQGRVTAENTRQSNETTRQNNESTRQSNESTRESNESQRESEFSTLKGEMEDIIDNAEQVADLAEQVAADTEQVKEIAAQMQIAFYYDEEGYPCADPMTQPSETTNQGV